MIENVIRKLLRRPPLTEHEIATRHIRNASDRDLSMISLEYHLMAMVTPEMVGKNGISLSEMLTMIDTELKHRNLRTVS